MSYSFKQNKYHNKKPVVNGEKFDSGREANRYSELLLLQRAHVISDLRRQVEYVLIPSQKDENGKTIENACRYYADFVYVKDGKTVVEDAKGFKTQEYVIKRKLMLHVYGIRIKEV